jgi:hypothetical protein
VYGPLVELDDVGRQRRHAHGLAKMS